jgi:uncharacterized protein (DUF4415 family)
MRRTKSTQADKIRALKQVKDREIDTTDIPPRADWDKAVVGKFYRPIKKPLTIRLDADVLAWLKGQGRGYRRQHVCGARGIVAGGAHLRIRRDAAVCADRLYHDEHRRPSGWRLLNAQREGRIRGGSERFGVRV